MRHRDIRSVEEIPHRTYRVTYRGEELFVEAKGRSALARLPEDTRGWRILCEMEGVDGSRTIYDGDQAWSAGRGAVAA